MKFVDESGDNVWWVKRTGYEFPTQWTPVRYKKRHIVKAWGPSPDRVLRNSAKLEFTIYNRVGGKGTVCLDALDRKSVGEGKSVSDGVRVGGRGSIKKKKK